MARIKDPDKPDIVEAFSNENIFGHYFPTTYTQKMMYGMKKGSWERWKVFLKAIYGIKIYGKNEKEIWEYCTNRTDLPESGFDEFYAIVGRRGGKSSIVSLIAVYEALYRDWQQYLSPGERATIFCVSTKKKQAQIVFRHCRSLLRNFEHRITNEYVECISLDNQVDIVIIPARFAGLRGYTIASVILDEFAFFPTEEYTNPAKEIIRSLKPAILPGGKLIGISTPYAKFGYLYDMFEKYYGKNGSRVLIWKAETDYMNPLYRKEKIAEEYEEDPTSAKTEYGAEFRDDVSTYLTEQEVNLITSIGAVERLPSYEKRYYAFVDVSGARKDSFAFAICHTETDSVVLDYMYECPAPYDVNEEVAKCSEHLRRYDVYQVTGDKYSGDVYAQKFREYHINYKFSELNKSEIFLEFQRVANLRRISLLDNPRLKSQLIALDRKPSRIGNDVVEKPPGGSDDLANAVAGATVLAYKKLLARPSKEELDKKSFQKFGKVGSSSSSFYSSWRKILNEEEKKLKEQLMKNKGKQNEKPI